jgi:hypothetical protein
MVTGRWWVNKTLIRSNNISDRFKFKIVPCTGVEYIRIIRIEAIREKLPRESATASPTKAPATLSTSGEDRDSIVVMKESFLEMGVVEYSDSL